MSWRITIRQLLFGALLLPLVVLLIGISQQATPGQADPALDAEESQFLTLINAYRVTNGHLPLTADTELNTAADWMSTDMGGGHANAAYFSHTDSNSHTPPYRAQTDPGHFTGCCVGENIAAGNPLSSAAQVLAAWQNSPPHNMNMLSDVYNVIGIGRVAVGGSPYGVYWTTDFGFSNNIITPSPTPSPTPSASPTPSPTPTITPTPTETQAPTPTATPTATPIHTPTPTHIPSPTTASSTPTGGAAPVNGDNDCDGDVDSVDGLKTLRHVAGLPVSQDEPCPDIGSPRNAAADEPAIIGDVDCDGDVDSVDGLKILRHVASLPVSQNEPCADIGT